jgi:hypothetical protein
MADLPKVVADGDLNLKLRYPKWKHFSMTEKTVRLPVVIAVSPYLQDHRFEGKAVFPAVEAMQVLAQSVKEFAPQTDMTAVTDTTFDKFLYIPSDAKKIDALCSVTYLENGDIRAVLQTKTRVKNAAFSRIKEHVTVHYPRIKPAVDAYRHKPLSFAPGGCLQISPDKIYRELVPFGPTYHNIAEKLTVHRDGALAKLRAPLVCGAIGKTGLLGSPFVLDAAFHTACVWGQRYGGVVAFPAGVERRIIVKPTRPGDTYASTAVPVRTDADRLIFDIFICGEDNTLYEIAFGVHMRDVSAGRMKPPAWIVDTGGKSKRS